MGTTAINLPEITFDSMIDVEASTFAVYLRNIVEQVRNSLFNSDIQVDLDTTQVNLVGNTNEQTLHTYTINGGQFVIPDSILKISFIGTTAHNAAVKTLKIKVGGNTIASKTLSGNDKDFWLDLCVHCIDANNQMCAVRGIADGNVIAFLRIAENAENNLPVLFTGQSAGGTASDITLDLIRLTISSSQNV